MESKVNLYTSLKRRIDIIYGELKVKFAFYEWLWQANIYNIKLYDKVKEKKATCLHRHLVQLNQYSNGILGFSFSFSF